MQLSLPELAALVGGHFAAEPEPALQVCNFATLKDAGKGDVTFYSNARYLSALRKCRATVVLVPLDFQEQVAAVCLRVEDPMRSFSEIVARFGPAPVKYPAGVHPTAVVGPGAELAEGVSLQPYVVVEAGAKVGARTVIGAHGFVGREAKLGEDCEIAAHVTIGERCQLGDRVVIHSGTVVGSDGFGFEFVEGHHRKIPQIGIVQIDDDVEVGANCAIDRGRFGRTWIKRGSKLDNLIQIAHNVVIGEHCLIVSQTGISGSTRLGSHVILGGQVGVVGHIEIADGAKIWAQSGVTKNLGAGEFTGTPAVPTREWRENVVHTRRLQLLIDRVARLEQELGSRPLSSPAPS